VNALAWGLVIVAYTATGVLWSGLFSSNDEPPLRATAEAQERWERREAQRTRRIWIWQGGLALLMLIWWVSTHR
jgi:hypothetical protein